MMDPQQVEQQAQLLVHILAAAEARYTAERNTRQLEVADLRTKLATFEDETQAAKQEAAGLREQLAQMQLGSQQLVAVLARAQTTFKAERKAARMEAAALRCKVGDQEHEVKSSKLEATMLRWQLADMEHRANAAAAQAEEQLAAERAQRMEAENAVGLLEAQQDRMAHTLSGCQQRLNVAKPKELHLTAWAKSLAAERDQAAANAEQLHRRLNELHVQHALAEKQAAEALRASQEQHKQEMQGASATFFDGLHRAHATISHLRGQLAEAEREALAGFQAVESLLACPNSNQASSDIKFDSNGGGDAAAQAPQQHTPQLVTSDSMAAPATPPAHKQQQLGGGSASYTPFPGPPPLVCGGRSFGSFVQRGDMDEDAAAEAPRGALGGSSVHDSNLSESNTLAGDNSSSSNSNSSGDGSNVQAGGCVDGWMEVTRRNSIREWPGWFSAR